MTTTISFQLSILFSSLLLLPSFETQLPRRSLKTPITSPTSGDLHLIHSSLNTTIRSLRAARDTASAIAVAPMDARARAAYDDCVELLDDSFDLLRQSIAAASKEDIQTWLSAAMTNHDTCSDGFEGVADGYVKRKMVKQFKELSLLVSNTLSIVTARSSQKFAGVPNWINWNERKLLLLLQTQSDTIQPDFIVSKDGNGTHKTIAEAVEAAPEGNSGRFVIYIKAGRYEENVKVGRKKINIMFVGEGKGRTTVVGSRSIYDNYTTFQTATFAATGTGIIIKDLTIENNAGPTKHQAVALRLGADHAVIYRCNIIGYQDTLYIHSQRHFFRQSHIYGTVDFIFGNAAAVFQKCNIYSRKPLPFQKITITAQSRTDPNQNTGISIHDCRILPAADDQSSGRFQTFLGRPWKVYSRVVYMESYLGGNVESRGWLEWNETMDVDKLYYGEYMNGGPGAAVGNRVRWPGFRVITSPEEAGNFTVGEFIAGPSWLPATGVAFVAGLVNL